MNLAKTCLAGLLALSTLSFVNPSAQADIPPFGANHRRPQPPQPQPAEPTPKPNPPAAKDGDDSKAANKTEKDAAKKVEKKSDKKAAKKKEK